MTGIQSYHAAHDHVRSHIVEFCAAQLIYVAAGKTSAEPGAGNVVRAMQASGRPDQPSSAVQDGKFPALIL